MPVRPLRPSGGGADRAAGIHRRGVARLSARGAAGPALRLSRLRPLRPGRRASLQPQQAAARPLCAGNPGRSCAGTTCCSATASAARARTSPSTAATARATCRNAGSSRPPLPGATTATRRRRGKRRSSSSCTCAGSPRRIRRVPEAHRGTFAALSSPAVIDYLVDLGITAIELLPIHATISERHAAQRRAGQLLGLQHDRLFRARPAVSAQRRRSTRSRPRCSGCTRRGIEVLLDVVYNHTGEGNRLGPTLSFRGIDNLSYYRLKDDRRYYHDDTGTGNTLNLEHPRVLQMVLELAALLGDRDAGRRVSLRPRARRWGASTASTRRTARSSTRSGRTRC